MTLLTLTGCDEGPIGNGEIADSASAGSVVRMTCRDVSGLDTWPDGYIVALAGFDTSGEYAVISKNVTGRETILSGIPDNVDRVEVCVIDKLRKRVASLGVASVTPDVADTVRIELDRLDAGMLDAIDVTVFATTCAQCHGATGTAAAGLDLHGGHARASLLGQQSRLVPGESLVVPGNASASVLMQVLSTDLSKTWRYDHTAEVVNETTLDMVRDWIDSGAN